MAVMLATTDDRVLFFADALKIVQESPDQPNRGRRVEGVQAWGGGTPGDSWCAFWATMVLDLAFAGNAPVERQGSCEAIRQLAQAKGWLTSTPSVADLVLSIDEAGRAHHVGIVTTVNPLTSIAGNTSADGTSANGTGTFAHTITPAHKLYVHYPR